MTIDVTPEELGLIIRALNELEARMRTQGQSTDKAHALLSSLQAHPQPGSPPPAPTDPLPPPSS